MITVEEALKQVRANISSLETISVTVKEGLNHVLAEDTFSPINMPPFRQSAMDGYAVNYTEKISNYKLIGEIPAGENGDNYTLKPGESVRIFTGAHVPDTANVVVKQEIVSRNGDIIHFTEKIKISENIRQIGEQIRENEPVLPKGSIITPASVGFLYGIGIDNIKVYRKPKISIIATGSELVKPGQSLPKGKIYESNSYMLSAALSEYGYYNHVVITIDDTYETTLSAIKNALENSDVLLLSGGISVGDYDFVGKALREIGVTELFYKVKQKPGKPLFFGKHNNKPIFALPGNPAAAMTSFYVYVLVGLDQLSGKTNPGLSTAKMEIKATYHKDGDRAQFLKAKTEENKVSVLGSQSSAMLKTFAIANAIAYIPSEINNIEKGNLILVYKL